MDERDIWVIAEQFGGGLSPKACGDKDYYIPANESTEIVEGMPNLSCTLTLDLA